MISSNGMNRNFSEFNDRMEYKMELCIEKVRKSKHRQAIKNIYTSAFPKEERMPFWMMNLMSCLWNTEFLAFSDQKTPCGLVYMATIGKQTFIMFLAVDEPLRSKGYGCQILTRIRTLHPDNKIIVSIEPCHEDAADIAIRLRRKDFYCRNGYQESGYRMKLSGTEQEILLQNGTFDMHQFKRFFMLYSNFTVIPKIWKSQSASPCSTK